MKTATYVENGKKRFALLVDDKVYDVESAAAEIGGFSGYSSLEEALSSENGIDNLKELAQKARECNISSISLDDVASYVGLSRTYLSSIFKKATGVSLFAYVNRFRVEVSKMLLVDTEMNMVEIAGECGFQDQSYFTRVFRKYVGISPKRYRSYRGNI